MTRSITGDIERLAISTDGTRLAIGSRGSFIVVDVVSQHQILVRNGRFPALSPDGSALAFVDDNRRLVVKNLVTGAEAHPLKGWSTYGVGRWSPNVRFLLAGAWVARSLFLSLVAVDARKGGYLELVKLGEGDYGSSSEWISQRLARALDPFVLQRRILR